MSATPKKKLCWNCDGNVPLKAEHCPYCGVYIEQTHEEEDVEEEHSPPYAALGARRTEEEAPTPPFKKRNRQALPKEKEETPKESSFSPTPTQRIVLPLGLLLCGSVLALFGLVLFLFADHGLFTLQWNSDHWPFYLSVGVLFLLGGLRLLNRADDPAT